MSISVEYESDGAGVVVKFRGHLNIVEYTKSLREIHTLDSLTVLRYKITDLTGVDSIETNVEEIRALSSFTDQIADYLDGFYHILVADNALLNTYIEVWRGGIKHDKVKVKVVKTLKEAQALRDEFLEALKKEKIDSADADMQRVSLMHEENRRNLRDIKSQIRKTMANTALVQSKINDTSGHLHETKKTESA